MSDTCINIRILFWYFQITTSKRFRFGFNDWFWYNRRFEALMNPVWIYAFSPSKYGSTSESEGEVNEPNT
jgi:hypothetical protein